MNLIQKTNQVILLQLMQIYQDLLKKNDRQFDKINKLKEALGRTDDYEIKEQDQNINNYNNFATKLKDKHKITNFNNKKGS